MGSGGPAGHGPRGAWWEESQVTALSWVGLIPLHTLPGAGCEGLGGENGISGDAGRGVGSLEGPREEGRLPGVGGMWRLEEFGRDIEKVLSGRELSVIIVLGG